MKQNKYQSALNYLDWHCNVEHKEQQDLLQELIDKETPMKPKKNDISNHDQFNNFCSRCGGSLFTMVQVVSITIADKIKRSDEE